MLTLTCFGLILLTVFYDAYAIPIWTSTLQREFVDDGIMENTPINTIIGTIHAQDSTIYVSMNDLFSVSDSGSVQILKKLDKESGVVYKAHFKALDSSQNEAEIEHVINVLNENDNAPVFDVDFTYEATVDENARQGHTVLRNIRVMDADVADSLTSQPTFTIRCMTSMVTDSSEKACAAFSVQQHLVSEVTNSFTADVVVKNPSLLSYSLQSQFNLMIEAVDSDQSPSFKAFQNVLIHIRDKQNLPPAFESNSLSVFISENQKKDTVVSDIVAFDQDIGSPRHLAISITKDDKSLFRLSDGSSSMVDGKVKVQLIAARHIDRELLNSDTTYAITVKAEELTGAGGIKALGENTATSAEIVISVSDINDNHPTFNAQRYTTEINEEPIIGSKVDHLNIVVTDSDLADNAKFNVSIDGQEDNEIFQLSPEVGQGTLEVNLYVRNNYYLDYEKVAYRSRTLKVGKEGMHQELIIGG